MSGPKRADVIAQLNVAQRSQRQCATLIAAAENAAMTNLLHEATGLLSDTDKEAGQLRNEVGGFDADMRRIAPDVIQRIERALESGTASSSEVRKKFEDAKELSNRAQQQERTAERTFENAEREYKKAEKALKTSDGHYLRKEMAWAEQATQWYEQAAQELNTAARWREEASKSTAATLQQVREAHGRLAQTIQQVASAKKEATSLLRAEAEAKRMLQEKQRTASMALQRTASALERINTLPHNKFVPGALDQLRQDLAPAYKAADSGDFDGCISLAKKLLTASEQLEGRISTAQKEHEKRKAEAETEIGVLEATIVGIDGDLIHDWSDQPMACVAARTAIDSALQATKEERYDEAIAAARQARQSLTAALRSAAAAKSSHDRREQTGNVIMEILHELQFDVSFDPGNRDEPLRIFGDTPKSAEGKGDFTIDIPLEGSVDFEVTSPTEDASCVGAVHELEKRLAARGIEWKTTDWGHATGVTHQEGNIRQKTQIKEQTRIKSRL